MYKDYSNQKNDTRLKFLTIHNSKLLEIPHESPLNLQNITDIVRESVYRDETRRQSGNDGARNEADKQARRKTGGEAKRQRKRGGGTKWERRNEPTITASYGNSVTGQ